MAAFILDLPIWQIIRSSGVISYILLTLGMCLGILYGFPIWSGKAKARLFRWHTIGTVSGTTVGLLHGIITAVDTYVTFSWREILVPFASHSDPVWMGFGTLALYGMLIVILTSDLRNRIGKTIWFALHMLSYPVFVMAFLHGYFGGTDSSVPGIRMIYVLSFVSIVVLTLLRGIAAPGAADEKTRKNVRSY